MQDHDAFTDVLAANEQYAGAFRLADLEATAARGLGVLTCMDSRIDPLGMLGLVPGDAKILRNAGARVTDDVLRTLVLASHLLDVDRVMIVAHTNCRMSGATRKRSTTPSVRPVARTRAASSFLTTLDQERSLRADVQRVRSSPYLGNVVVGGFMYDLDTGRLRQVT